MLSDLQIQRPKIEQLLTANELLDDKWTVLVANDDHYVIDGKEGCIAAINGEDSKFFLDVEECEALVLIRSELPEVLRYLLRLEKVAARMERRLEKQQEDI